MVISDLIAWLVVALLLRVDLVCFVFGLVGLLTCCGGCLVCGSLMLVLVGLCELAFAFDFVV